MKFENHGCRGLGKIFCINFNGRVDILVNARAAVRNDGWTKRTPILHLPKADATKNKTKKKQGPVVKSIVSLTSSLRSQLVKCFTTS